MSPSASLVSFSAGKNTGKKEPNGPSGTKRTARVQELRVSLSKREHSGAPSPKSQKPKKRLNEIKVIKGPGMRSIEKVRTGAFLFK